MSLRQDSLRRALEELPNREAQVLRLWFGLDQGERMTLAAVGGLLGLPAERSRQIEAQALSRLSFRREDPGAAFGR